MHNYKNFLITNVLLSPPEGSGFPQNKNTMKKTFSKFGKIFLLCSLIATNIFFAGHVNAESKRRNNAEKVADIEQTNTDELPDGTIQEEPEKVGNENEEVSETEVGEENNEQNSDISEKAQGEIQEDEPEIPDSSLYLNRPIDAGTPGTLVIENKHNLSRYDTVNTMHESVYTVRLSNLTTGQEYFYSTSSEKKSYYCNYNGEAEVKVTLRDGQKVEFFNLPYVRYVVITEADYSSQSYTGVASAGTVSSTSGQAGVGTSLSTGSGVIDPSGQVTFSFIHQFYYNLTLDSSIVSSVGIQPIAKITFPESLKGKTLPVQGSKDSGFTSVTVGDSLVSEVTLADDQKLVIGEIPSSSIDEMEAASSLISIPKVAGYTSSMNRHLEDDGSLKATIGYNEHEYSIIYHGNGADDEMTSTMVDDDIQDTYSFTTKDDTEAHYFYAELTRNGDTINYKLSISPIGVIYLRNRPATITVNGVSESVTLNAPSGEITQIYSGSFKINDTGDTMFSCRIVTDKTHLMTKHWTADFGSHKLGTRTKYQASKIIDDVAYSEPWNLRENPYTKTGYLFTGWNTTAEGTGKDYSEKEAVSSLAGAEKEEDSIDMYAQWAPIHYTVRYDGNGKTDGSMSDSLYTYDQSGNLSPNQFKQNYSVTLKYNYAEEADGTIEANSKFNEWKGSDGKIYADKASVRNLTSKDGEQITMIAQWTPVSVTLPSPSRKGYTFNGWYTAASGGTKVSSGGTTIVPNGNETYYAHWTANKYTVNLDPNGGNGNISSVEGEYDTPLHLSQGTFTRPKHKFLYWSTEKNGGGTRYYPDDSIMNLTSDTGNVTLYAQWEKLVDMKVDVKVSGNLGNRAKDFSFTTVLPDCFKEKSFTVVKADGTNEKLKVDETGQIQFSLKHGETFTILDLDTEQAKAVKNLGRKDFKEEDVSIEGYTSTITTSEDEDGTIMITFAYTRNTGVPTGLHIGNGSMWMMIIGTLGLTILILLKM